MRRLTRRAQFLRAARGARASKHMLALQMVTAENGSEPFAGVGFTVTKKVGNAPERNRIKRRLRAAVNACSTQFDPHNDYVLIGRRAALDVPFSGLVAGLGSLLDRVHAPNTALRQNSSRQNRSAKRT